MFYGFIHFQPFSCCKMVAECYYGFQYRTDRMFTLGRDNQNGFLVMQSQPNLSGFHAELYQRYMFVAKLTLKYPFYQFVSNNIRVTVLALIVSDPSRHH